MVRTRTISALFALIILLFPAFTFAAGLPTSIVTCSGAVAADGMHACGVCDLAQLAQNVLNTGIYIAVFLSAILFAYAGGIMVTAGGNSEKISSARSIFTNVAIGLVIILAGWLVVDTLMRTLVGTNNSFGPWNRICSTTAMIPTEHIYV